MIPYGVWYVNRSGTGTASAVPASNVPPKTKRPRSAPPLDAVAGTRSDEEQALAIPDQTIAEILARLSRVEGQVRAVQRMIAERRDCHAIAHQMAAAKAALSRATVQLMTASMAQCLATGKDAAELARLTDAFAKLVG